MSGMSSCAWHVWTSAATPYHSPQHAMFSCPQTQRTRKKNRTLFSHNHQVTKFSWLDDFPKTWESFVHHRNVFILLCQFDTDGITYHFYKLHICDVFLISNNINIIIITKIYDVFVVSRFWYIYQFNSPSIIFQWIGIPL